MKTSDNDYKYDIIHGHTIRPEYFIQFKEPEPLTRTEKLKIFWREFCDYYLLPAVLTTISVGCWAFFIASIFKWVLM